VHEGDWIGIAAAGGNHSGIVAIAPGLTETATSLLDLLVTDDHEIVTLVVGEGVNEATTAELGSWLETNRPDVEVEVHYGGQPLYAFYIGVE
jgi:dihydroxyacetone kinase-like predicted kinase